MSIAQLQGVFRIDVARIPPEIWEGLNSGRMTLSASKGNVYWAAGSGQTGIAAQLPLVQVSAEELASAQQLMQLGQAVKSAQVAGMVTTAVAAAVVVAVVVAATAYLSAKIKRVETAVREVEAIVRQQDGREYLHYLSDYAGAVQAGVELLAQGDSPEEMHRLVVPRLDRLAELRQKTLHFMRSFPALLDQPGTTAAQYGQGLRFMIEMLDLVPAALSIEHELSLVGGLPEAARARRQLGAAQFRGELAEFRRWCEAQYRAAALGEARHIDALTDLRGPLFLLFNSPMHGLWLDGLMAALAAQPDKAGAMGAVGTAAQVPQPAPEAQAPPPSPGHTGA